MVDFININVTRSYVENGMNIKTLKQCLPYILKAKITPWLWGFHGRGKSQVIEGIFAEMGWLCFNFRLGTQADVGDLLGQQEIAKDPKSGEVFTTFHKPEWMHNAFEFCKANPDKGAVIFLDELNRIFRQDLIPPVFQMALDYRLHTYEFPDNLYVIVAGNPDTSNYKVIKFRDEAFYDRFCHIKFDPSMEEWFSHARNEKVSPEILGFLQEQPEFLEQSDLSEFSISQYVSPGRRSWLAVDRLDKLDIPKKLLHEIASGIVGVNTIVAWQDYKNKGGKPIPPEKILNEYAEVRVNVLKFSGFGAKSVRGDILKTTCDNLSEYLVSNFGTKDVLLKDTQKDNLACFMKDIPGEIFFDFSSRTGKNCVQLIDLLNSDRELLNILKSAKGDV